ncbi:MAG: glycerol-3-phosphate 1-O-acyltransferase PlsY [Verrucomicrobiota bacterium]|nr:glycerol-3-phosphate 1-O-acyltransferase PlsY [Verrucomicrobiota bacterium]
MPTAALYASCLLASYLLGAIPFAFLLAQVKGIDIRAVGSGNIGATNAFRCVSKPLGILCFFCDVAKGFAPAFFFPMLVRQFAALPNEDPLKVLCAAGAIAGHNWPVYLRFKGGKGVATSAGALLGISWLPVTIGIAAWVLVFLLSRYVSVASLLAAAVVAACAWILPTAPDALLIPIAFTLLAILAIWRHKSNIRRLVNGAEHRFESVTKKRKDN